MLVTFGLAFAMISGIKISLNKIAEIEDLHEHNELTYFTLKDIVT